MAIAKTKSQFKVVETAAAASKVPFQSGQYIITDAGECFYDPSTGTKIEDRVALSPDLSGFLTRSINDSLVTDVSVSESDGNVFKIDVTKKATADGYAPTTESFIFKSNFITGSYNDETKTLTMNVQTASTVTAGDTKPVTGGAVKTAIDTAKSEMQGKIDEAATAATAVVTVLTATASATDAESLATIKTPKQGDIAIVKRLINEAVANNPTGTDPYQYTAYVYNNKAWQAMDGNYSAENVYFPEDLITTSAIGNITLSGGQATIPVAGKNLTDTWQQIFVKETNTGLKTADPSAKIAGNSLKYIQVGSSASQSLTVSMGEDGSYKYGYTTENLTEGQSASKITNNGSTGVVVDATTPYSMTYKVGSAEAKSLTATGTAKNTFTVDSGVQTAKTSATVTATIKYGQGGIPVSNLKKAYPAQRIAAGTKSTAATEIFRWYIPMYHGFKMAGATVANPAAVTAADITSLSRDVDATAYSQTKRTSDAASGSWMQYFIAVPSSYNWNISGAKDANNLTLDIKKGNKVSITLGTATVEYQVWYINNAAAYDTKNIVITW